MALCLVVMCSVPVWAQEAGDFKIRVIQDDGSVQEVDIPTRKVKVEPQPETPKGHVRFVPATPEAEDITEPVSPKQKTAALPRRKRAPDVARPRHKPVMQTLPGGVSITGEMAKYIALEVAPPASRIDVFSQTYQGQPVFVVMFQGDEGAHEVLVDSISGEIIASREAMETVNAPKTYVPMPVRR